MFKRLITTALAAAALTGAGLAAAAPANADGLFRTCPDGYYGVILEDPNGTPFFVCVKG